eukprot:jgi/Botrbrau1/4227/Bobra.0044s0023.1
MSTRAVQLLAATLGCLALAAAQDPPPFDWGVATSSYQIEGAAAAGGRKPSIWDTFSKDAGANGVLFFEKYLADIEIMKQLGVKNFRMSISWARFMPDGTGAVNAEGLDFYTRVIDALLDAGITPWVLLYHWDMPQSIQDSYGGWTNDQIVPDFTAYATNVFKAFGTKVKKWMTFNEPKNFCFLGYGTGFHAPGIRDYGGPTPWKCVFNVIRTQAAVAEVFRKIVPDGELSIALDSEWAVPFSDSQEDKDAALRYLDLRLGIFADPIYLGHWPQSIASINNNLPPINATLSAQLLANKPHFFGINHYTSKFVKNLPGATGGAGEGPTNLGDGYDGPDNQKISPIVADSTWLYVYPEGFTKLLAYVNDKYKPTNVVITENGVDEPGEFNATFPDVLQDDFRINYFKGYIQAAADAVTQDKVPISVYFAWSLLDNFEWQNGYTNRFGIVYVDYNNGYKRYLKASAKFLANLFGTWNKPGPSLMGAVSAPAPGPSASGLIRLVNAPQGTGAPAVAPAVAVRNPRPQNANPMIGS